MKDFFDKKKHPWRRLITCIVGLGIVIMCVISLKTYSDDSNLKVVPYSTFLSEVQADEVECVVYSTSSPTMSYYKYTDKTKKMNYTERSKLQRSVKTDKDVYTTYYPASEGFREDMLKAGVVLIAQNTNTLAVTLVSTIFEFGFIILLFVLLTKNMTKMVSGKPNFNMITDNDTKFSDVIGHEEVIHDLDFIVKFMKNPKAGKRLGAKIPKGVLFTGPPGTGKTLLARAIAGECKVPFFQVDGSSFIEMYVGLGASRVRQLFEEAKKNAPCIVFIDEIDAIGGSRTGAGATTTSEHRQTLNTLLQCMDGFTPDTNILVIAATNFPDELDKALTRSGRFDRRIEIAPPRDVDIRIDMLKHYLEDKTLGDDVNLRQVAKEMSGFTGADINSVCNEAALVALENDHEAITKNDIEEAIDKRLTHGNRSRRKRTDTTEAIVRYHEAGHAVMHYLLDLPIVRITVTGTTSGVGGFVMGEDNEEMQTKKFLEDQLTILYAGRCSEIIKFGEENMSIGASMDIKEATKILHQYVSCFGFTSDQGLIDYSIISDKPSQEILESMRDVAKSFENKCMTLLKNNYDLVEKLATALKEKPTLTAEEVEDVLEIKD